MSTPSALFRFSLPDYWTPAEALAVYEFLNELAETIWNRYEVVLLEQLRSEHHSGDTAQPDLFDLDDPIPF